MSNPAQKGPPRHVTIQLRNAKCRKSLDNSKRFPDDRTINRWEKEPGWTDGTRASSFA